MGTVKAISLPKASAGILLFRRKGENIEVLLGHPGGPFWKKKDQGAWTVPNGLIAFGEPPLERPNVNLLKRQAILRPACWCPLAIPNSPAARRCMFGRRRMTGIQARFGAIPSRWSGHRVPGGSKAFLSSTAPGWFDMAEARDKMLKGQAVFLDRLSEALAL